MSEHEKDDEVTAFIKSKIVPNSQIQKAADAPSGSLAERSLAHEKLVEADAEHTEREFESFKQPNKPAESDPDDQPA